VKKTRERDEAVRNTIWKTQTKGGLWKLRTIFRIRDGVEGRERGDSEARDGKEEGNGGEKKRGGLDLRYSGLWERVGGVRAVRLREKRLYKEENRLWYHCNTRKPPQSMAWTRLRKLKSEFHKKRESRNTTRFRERRKW